MNSCKRMQIGSSKSQTQFTKRRPCPGLVTMALSSHVSSPCSLHVCLRPKSQPAPCLWLRL